jgi:carbon-monoxide dehydrogenase medium subunit
VQAIEYVAPSTLDEALKALSNGNVRILAGGTDLIVQARENRRNVTKMVDVKNVKETTELTLGSDGSLRVGAATACATIYENADVAKKFPALIDSAELIGGIQIQSRASLGGNLCNSSPAADSIPTMIALGAQAEIAGAKGKRSVPVEDFCTAPGRNVLADDEMLVALSFPAPAAKSGAAFERFIPRNEMDIAVVGAAVNVTLDAKGVCTDARVVLGAVAPTAVLVPEAAAALTGHKLDDAALAALDAAVRKACKPIDDKRGTIAYRTKVAGVMARRAAAIAFERAGERQ